MGSTNKPANIFESFTFIQIFRTFRMAIQPSKLLIAFVAIAVLSIAGWLMDFSNSVVATSEQYELATELHVYVADSGELEHYLELYQQTGNRQGVYETLWGFARQRFHGAMEQLFAFNLTGVAQNIALYMRAIQWAIKEHWFYCSIFSIIKLAVIAIAGGAICRISSLQFARDEKPGLMEALRFSYRRFAAFFITPIGLSLAVFGPMLIVIAMGLLVNIPALGDLILILLLPIMLLIGFVVALIIIGVIGGYSLIYPAIAYDGADAFDAVGRSLNYVRSKPWQLGFYYAVAAVYGSICYLFARFVAFLMLWITHVMLRIAVGADSAGGASDKIVALWAEPSLTRLYTVAPMVTTKWESFIAYIIYLTVLTVIGLLIAFIVSFYFSGCTVIYALMRKKVDNTPFDDVYIYHEEPKFEPETEQAESVEEEPQDDEQPDEPQKQTHAEQQMKEDAEEEK